MLSNLHFLAVPKFIAFIFILPFMGLHPSSISYIELIALYGLISLEFPMLNLLQHKCNIVYKFYILTYSCNNYKSDEYFYIKNY